MQGEQTFQRLLALAEKEAGRESTGLTGIRGLSDLYINTGDYGKAEPLIQEQMATIEKTLGSDHPAMIAALSVRLFASTPAGHGARPRRARTRPRHCRTIARFEGFYCHSYDRQPGRSLQPDGRFRPRPSLDGEGFGPRGKPLRPEPSFLANTLQNLGINARETGENDRAIAFLQRALSIREKALGSSHLDTAALLINIGNVHHARRDFPNALEMHLRAFDVLTSSAGPYHRLTLMALANAGKEYAAEGDRAHALEFHARYADAIDKDIALHLSIGSEREKFLYVSSSSVHVDRTVSFHVNGSDDDQRLAPSPRWSSCGRRDVCLTRCPAALHRCAAV